MAKAFFTTLNCSNSELKGGEILNFQIFCIFVQRAKNFDRKENLVEKLAYDFVSPNSQISTLSFLCQKDTTVEVGVKRG